MLRCIVLILVFWLAACTSNPAQPPVSIIETDPPKKTPVSVSASQSPVPVQQKMVDLVVSDISKRLSIKPESVHVISIESAIWVDAGLGCPRPDVVYAQGTVPGFQVRLEAGGLVYEYHTDTDDHIVLCVSPDLPEFPVTPGEIDDGQPWIPVD